jgi:DNA-binding IclR family transcriptional regulator
MFRRLRMTLTPGPRVSRALPARSLPKLTAHTITRRTELRAVLQAARTRGYAVERQEFEDGIGCLSAPYFNLAGTVAGSLIVAMPVARVDAD